MIYVWYLALGISGIFILIKAMHLLVLLFASNEIFPDTRHNLSVLVAARNEEAHIRDCLLALSRQKYPADKIEFLIGDDDSDDRTAEIITDFIKDKPNFRHFRIAEKLEGIKGKQNVLAQLAKEAKGDIILITDADIRTNPFWAATLAGAFADAKLGMVSGPTFVWGKGLFAHLQGLDWLMGISLSWIHSKLGIPLTGVGNNMAFRKEAYDSVGGYEKVPFSIVEDYKLFEVMCQKGPWKFRQLFHPFAEATSTPSASVGELAAQRLRWFRGGMDLPVYNKLFLLINALHMPILILSAIFLPVNWFLFFYFIRVLGDLLHEFLAASRIGKGEWLVYYIPYIIYYQLLLIFTPLILMSPAKVIWKGRKY